MSEGEFQGQNVPDTVQKGKRKRIAHACLICRKRKLKCDLELPSCGRCRQSDHPEACTYDYDAVEENISRQCRSMHASTPITETAKDIGDVYIPAKAEEDRARLLQERVEHLENRVVGLEMLIKRSHSEVSSVNLPFKSTTDFEDLRSTENEWMIYRGRDYKTMFYGASHPTICLPQMPTLGAFMKDMSIKHPRAPRIRAELKSLKAKPRRVSMSVSDNFLLTLLPSKEVVDHCVKLYVDNIETFYRVLHLPSFWMDYSKLWSSPSNIEPGFVCLVLLMQAATYCLSTHNPQRSTLSPFMARKTACYWIEECEIWLSRQAEKRTSLKSMQSRCVLLIAQQMQSYNRKRKWVNAETLMSFAISKGLHRDADIVNRQSGERKISIFNQEMRKRLWSTVAELELENALERGMPSSFVDLKIDCGAPSNCMDEVLQSEMEHTPESRPDSQFTSSSYQSVAAKTKWLRQHVACSLNGTEVELSHVEILVLDGRVLKCLKAVPTWEQPGSLVPRSLLQLQLYQLLLLLHQKFANSQDDQHTYSRSTSMGAAKAIIDLHHHLLIEGHRVFMMFRQDLRHAALSVSYNLVTSQGLIDTLSLPTFFSSIEADHTVLLEEAEMLVKDRLDVSGTGLKDYYLVVACLGLVRKSKNSNRNEEYLAAQKVVGVMEQWCAQLNTSNPDESSQLMEGSAFAALQAGGDLTNTTIANHGSGSDGRTIEDTAHSIDSQLDPNLWDFDAFLNY